MGNYNIRAKPTDRGTVKMMNYISMKNILLTTTSGTNSCYDFVDGLIYTFCDEVFHKFSYFSDRIESPWLARIVDRISLLKQKHFNK